MINGYFFTLILLIIALFVGLGILAARGSIIALAGLVALLTVFLVGLGLFVGLAYFWMAEKSKQQSFRDNTVENLKIMQEVSRAQNLQAKGAYDHMRATRQLPEPNGHEAGLDILDGVFSDLDD